MGDVKATFRNIRVEFGEIERLVKEDLYPVVTKGAYPFGLFRSALEYRIAKVWGYVDELEELLVGSKEAENG